MHAASGTVALLAASYLSGFALVKGESPRGYSLPILIIIFVIAAIIWILTRPRMDDSEPEPTRNTIQATDGDHSPLYHLENSPVIVQTPAPAPQQSGSQLNRGLAGGLTELETIKRRLLQAGATKQLQKRLPHSQHHPLADLLTDQGWHASRQILDDAYGACEDLWERLHVSSRRWDGGAIPEMIIPTIEESDDLPGVLDKVEAAIAELREKQGATDALPIEEAQVQFANVEIGASRWIREPNVFNEDWKGVPIVFNLINPQGSVRARAIRPTVTVRDPDGVVLAGPANARWSNPQPPRTEEVERDIPANGAPVAIDSVVQPVGGDRFWLVTDENLRLGLKATKAIDAPDLRVTVSIQGENVPQASQTVQVQLGFPDPTVGDEKSANTLLPPEPELKPDTKSDSNRIDKAAPDAGVDPAEVTDSDGENKKPNGPSPTTRSGSQSTLEKLWVEGRKMQKAAGPFAALGAGALLYGAPPTEAQIDRWQGRVRAALPPAHRRRFRFAPLEAEASESPLMKVGFPSMESVGARRLKKSLEELQRIMDELDEL